MPEVVTYNTQKTKVLLFCWISISRLFNSHRPAAMQLLSPICDCVLGKVQGAPTNFTPEVF